MNPTRHRRHSALACAAVVVTGMLFAAVPAHGTSVAPLRAVTPSEMTAAEVEAALVAAEASATAASKRALNAETAAQNARADVGASAERASALTAQSAAADAEFTAHTARVGGLAAGLYRTASSAPLLARVLTSADPESLLARLGTLERLTEASASLAGRAREVATATASQREQAALAQAEYERLAAEADAAAEAARTDAAAESLAVSAAQAELDALYERLAALTRTSRAQAQLDRLDRSVAQQAVSQPGASGGTPGAGGSPAASPIPVPAPPAPPAPAPSTPAPPTPGTAVATPAQAQAVARSALSARGWGDEQFSCLVRLWNRESGWRVQARNPSSGAYGIPQAYPAEKLASAGPDWRTSAATQIAWGLSYIGQRYGSPCAAWEHSARTGWY